uniref:cAMP-dependent protein kinase inhibitor beta n=1 Tax=Ovis aries TaxID=9940 RepID=A0AC11D5U6_SHEEP
MDLLFRKYSGFSIEKNPSDTGFLRGSADVTMRTDSPKMTDVEPVVSNFASSARAGRRNAVPDIQGSTAAGGTLEELPVKLEALSVKEDVKKKDEETAQDQLEKPKDEGK